MKLLLDMNLSPRWLALLSDSGFDAIHWSAVGPVDATDLQVMAYAAANDCVVLTHDLDFSAILAVSQGRKPSVVQIRARNLRPEQIGTQVLVALRQMTREIEEGALLTVDPARARIRVLPLAPRT
jgi:predicted nuclease of predicted toxin-antitoxin system